MISTEGERYVELLCLDIEYEPTEGSSHAAETVSAAKCVKVHSIFAPTTGLLGLRNHRVRDTDSQHQILITIQVIHKETRDK